MGKKIVEGLWDCAYCDNKGIRGRERVCPGCGKPRGEGVRFYLPKGGEKAKDVKLGEREKLPDWQCAYCGSYNSAASNECKFCTAPRDGKDYYELHKDVKRSHFSEDYTDTRWKCAFCGNMNEASSPKCLKCGADRADPSKTEPAEENRGSSGGRGEDGSRGNRQRAADKKPGGFWGFVKRNPALFIVLGVIFIPLIISTIIGFIGSNRVYTVESVKWSRTIEVEKYKTVRESDWELPPGARLIRTQREIHHYESSDITDPMDRHRELAERSADGEKTNLTAYISSHSPFKRLMVYADDLGNGFFEVDDGSDDGGGFWGDSDDDSNREVPVYRTKYYYEIERWVHERDIYTEGPRSEEPYWGDMDLENDERESGRYERHFFEDWTDKGKFGDYDLDDDLWMEVNPGDRVRVRIQFDEVQYIVIED